MKSKSVGFEVNEECINIFLEYVAGGSISSVLKRLGPFPEEIIHSFVHQILTGLRYLHERDILHRVSYKYCPSEKLIIYIQGYKRSQHLS